MRCLVLASLFAFLCACSDSGTVGPAATSVTDPAADMEAYIARLNGIDEVMREYLDRSRRAVEDGIRQPRFNYDFAIGEIGRVMSGAPFTEEGDSPLWADVQAKIAAL